MEILFLGFLECLIGCSYCFAVLVFGITDLKSNVLEKMRNYIMYPEQGPKLGWHVEAKWISNTPEFCKKKKTKNRSSPLHPPPKAQTNHIGMSKFSEHSNLVLELVLEPKAVPASSLKKEEPCTREDLTWNSPT